MKRVKTKKECRDAKYNYYPKHGSFQRKVGDLWILPEMFGVPIEDLDSKFITEDWMLIEDSSLAEKKSQDGAYYMYVPWHFVDYVGGFDLHYVNKEGKATALPIGGTVDKLLAKHIVAIHNESIKND